MNMGKSTSNRFRISSDMSTVSGSAKIRGKHSSHCMTVFST